MSELTWLHISDWHQEGNIFDTKVVCDELINDIDNRLKISPDLERIDFIVFSGDVAQGGKTKQYDDAYNNFFKPILKACNIDPEFLFIVPGNHDQDHDAISPDLPKDMESNAEVNTWWNEDEKRSKILKPFRAFIDFKRDHLGQTTSECAETKLWDFDQRKIALLGINSAWMCALRKDENGKIIDQGNLCIGEPQIYEPLKKISEADIKIAVLHHPLDWLAPLDLGMAELRLKKNCRFILHGHGHKPGVSVNYDTFGYYIVIPAGACYDRKKSPGSDCVVVCRNFCKFNGPDIPLNHSKSIDKYFLVVSHSSLISINSETPSLINELSLGKAPTTLVLRFSSLLILSSPFVVRILFP